MKNIFLPLALLSTVSTSCFAAPARTSSGKNQPAKKELKKQPVKPALSAPRGVNITPITRNRTESKVGFQLAREGVALAPIVISEKAGAATKLAAAELKKYLDQISGADFKIEIGDGQTGLVLGTMQEFPVPALSKALEIVNGFDGKEAYAIRTREKRVLLLGATEKGASHAAYRFLEELGCRWFFQSDAWQVIPSTPDLKFNLDITDRPSFLARRIWWGWAFFDDRGHPGSTPEKPRNAVTDYNDWARRNAMDFSFTANAGHAYEAIVHQNKELMDAHPEYRALVNGKRQGNHLELSNPGARKMVVDYAINYFKKNPNADMVSVDPEDGGGVSQSEESKAMGSPGDIAFDMANEVAKALQKAYPGQNKMVGLYAYSWHSDPPPFKLEPNVYVQLAGSVSGKLTYAELLEAWPKKTRNLGFYQYFAVYDWTGDRWPGGGISSINNVKWTFDSMAKANKASGTVATSFDAESSNSWSLHGRGYYLANKMGWNPDINIEATLDDFYTKAFGAGASEMKKFFEMQDNPPPITPGVFGALYRHVAAASRATQNDAAVQRRLDDIKNGLRWQYFRFRASHETDAAKQKQLLLDAWKHVYRTRYDYMNHWAAIWQMEAARSGMDKSLWADPTPMTHEETEKNFQEGLAFFPELKLPPPVNFSKDLVAVNLGGQRVATSQFYQEGGRYAFLSLRGEPLKIKIQTRFAGRHIWTISDAKGKVLKTEKFGEADKTVEFEFPVPAPGVYYLDYTDTGAYGTVFLAADQHVALTANERVYRAMRPVSEMYFYVPKGTREIVYYYQKAPWQDGGPHQVIDPEGKVVKTVTDLQGDYVFVPVPAGMDGKAWRLGGPQFVIGKLLFLTVPGYLSPSPAAMLVPREVAKQDGLTVLR